MTEEQLTKAKEIEINIKFLEKYLEMEMSIDIQTKGQNWVHIYSTSEAEVIRSDCKKMLDLTKLDYTTLLKVFKDTSELQIKKAINKLKSELGDL